MHFYIQLFTATFITISVVGWRVSQLQRKIMNNLLAVISSMFRSKMVGLWNLLTMCAKKAAFFLDTLPRPEKDVCRLAQVFLEHQNE